MYLMYLANMSGSKTKKEVKHSRKKLYVETCAQKRLSDRAFFFFWMMG
jgi:hypothetical protein